MAYSNYKHLSLFLPLHFPVVSIHLPINHLNDLISTLKKDRIGKNMENTK